MVSLKNIENNYSSIFKFISKRQIKESLELLSGMVDMTKTDDYKHQFDQIDVTYKYMVNYFVLGYPDPSRQQVYNQIVVNILDLLESVRRNLLMKNSDYVTPIVKQELLDLSVLKDENIDSYIETISGYNFMEDEVMDPLKKEELWNNRNTLIIKLFNRIWLVEKLNETDQDLIKRTINSNLLSWSDKCLIISSLTLSLWRFFDPLKFELLIHIYDKSEHQLWQRALIGLVISFNAYDSRIQHYTDLMERIKKVYHSDRFEKCITTIIIQLIKSKDTENLTRQIQEEIIPEVSKLRSKLTNKLGLENIVNEDMSEEKNPDWEKFFEDTPDLLKKMGELSQMQLEGSDVFMGTFAALKHFDFFKQLSNWFLPFSSQNFFIKNYLGEHLKKINKEKFIESMEKVPFICNSDKYSFCLNLQNLPDAQKSMIISLFTAEIQDMNEIAKDEKLLHNAEDKFIFTQYIQDLYRFYKLHPLHQLFADIFNLRFDFHNSDFFDILVKDSTILKKIGEYYFDKNYYEEASEIYQILNKKGLSEYETFQKIAYCFQKKEKYQEALDYYLKAELYDKNKTWNQKKIAFCYQKMKEYDKGLSYLLEVEKAEPENLEIQAKIGRCFLDLKNFEQALKYFFKVEYLAPSNIKVLRPIAWCYFMMGKFENAIKFIDKVIKIEGNSHDFINLGHIQWCMGNITKASELYLKSIHFKDNTYQLFLEEFNEDLEYLKLFNLKEEEIFFMHDHLKYSTKD